MKLCSTKNSVTKNRLRRFALAGIAWALILGLPVAGGVWSGLPVSVWSEFPPRHGTGIHAGFNWTVFLALALLLAAVGAGVTRRALRGKNRLREGAVVAPASRAFPAWGWWAVGWTLVAWWVAWTRWPVFAAVQHYTYIPVWFGAIAGVQALLWRRTGRCLLTHRPGMLAGLAFLSAAFWWGFECLNRAVQNWYYQNLEGFTPLAYAIFATIAFSTVLPAVLGVHDLLAAYPRWTAGFADWVRIRFSRPRMAGAGFALTGAVGLFLLPVCPDALFPLLWMAPLSLLCGLLAIAGEETLFDNLGRGDWRALIRLSVAALICGGFWEMWNAGSLARWVYDIPYVGRFHLFEMPVLGYAGYAPFGWECGAVAMLLGLWQPPDEPRRGGCGWPGY